MSEFIDYAEEDLKHCFNCDYEGTDYDVDDETQEMCCPKCGAIDDFGFVKPAD